MVAALYLGTPGGEKEVFHAEVNRQLPHRRDTGSARLTFPGGRVAIAPCRGVPGRGRRRPGACGPRRAGGGRRGGRGASRPPAPGRRGPCAARSVPGTTCPTA